MSTRTKAIRRRGMMLVELVAVMIAGAALMGVTVAAFVALQRADRRFAHRQETQDLIDQLGEALRRDIHAADAAAWDADARVLALTDAGGDVIEYRLATGRWERRARIAGGSAEGELAGAYRLPRGMACAVEVVSRPAGDLVRLVLEPKVEDHDPRRRTGGPHTAELIMAIGRDRELLAL